jgi:hypothetical protein
MHPKKLVDHARRQNAARGAIRALLVSPEADNYERPLGVESASSLTTVATWTSQLLMDTLMVPRGCFKISRTEAA